MCREDAGSVSANGGCFYAMIFSVFSQGGVFRVSGAVPQMAAQGVLRRNRAGTYHRDPEKAGGGGAHLSCLPVHWQDHLCQNSGQGRQLRTPGQRRSLLPMPQLHRAGKRQLSGCAGTGRRLQQRRGSGTRPAGRGYLCPGQREKAGLYRGRGSYAVCGGFQRPAEKSGGAARPPDGPAGPRGTRSSEFCQRTVPGGCPLWPSRSSST